MLSQALERANLAVQLDGNNEIDGAILAYEQACELLEAAVRADNSIVNRQRLMVVVSFKQRARDGNPSQKRIPILPQRERKKNIKIKKKY
jgi:hypothetical protein